MPPEKQHDYEVGYGKPPRHTRFAKGQSGNPRGRPSGAKNFTTLLSEALNEPVIVTENGRRRKVSKRKAIATQLVNRSAKADLRSTKLVLDMLRDLERPTGSASPEACEFGEADQKVLEQLKARFVRRRTVMFKNLTQAEYDVILRRDLATFAGRCFQELNPQTCLAINWHLEVIAAKLTAVRERKIRRLIINLPPRHLKSLMASIAFPAWCLGHDPTAQILCVSYAQDLADKLARDCRGIMMSPWYRRIFPTRLAPHRQAVQEFITTRQGYRLSTSTGGVLTGRGADIILIDDPLKPEEALSDTQRLSGNEWYDHTLYSRLNDKRHGAIIIIMQRLHEDDLVGHVLAQEDWEVVRFPAIAEADEAHEIETIFHPKRFRRLQGEALHPEREPLDVLDRIRRTIGEYNFAGQYQQSPAPLGGGLVKAEWFKRYRQDELPERFDHIVQSWDTANKATELSDFSVCTTWGAKEKELFLLSVFRRRLEYPALKRAVREQQTLFDAKVVLIEDKASGTQLIQELIADGCRGVARYQPTTDKVMRLHAQTALIESGFVRIPEAAPWLAEYLHELTVFPKGKHDDQADSTAQFLDWYKKPGKDQGYIDWLREAAERVRTQNKPEPPKTNWAVGSMQWQEERRKRREADLARAAAEDKREAERAAAAKEDKKREAQRAAAEAVAEA